MCTTLACFPLVSAVIKFNLYVYLNVNHILLSWHYVTVSLCILFSYTILVLYCDFMYTLYLYDFGFVLLACRWRLILTAKTQFVSNKHQRWLGSETFPVILVIHHCLILKNPQKTESLRTTQTIIFIWNATQGCMSLSNICPNSLFRTCFDGQNKHSFEIKSTLKLR